MAASKKHKNRIRATPPPGGAIPSDKVPRSPRGILFSFKYLTDPPFDSVPYAGFWELLLERLRLLSGMTMEEMHGNHSKTLRAHPVDWSNTTQPNGFSHLRGGLEDLTGHQFGLGQSKGRVFGFIIETTFFICWLDPLHQVYRNDS